MDSSATANGEGCGFCYVPRKRKSFSPPLDHRKASNTHSFPTQCFPSHPTAPFTLGSSLRGFNPRQSGTTHSPSQVKRVQTLKDSRWRSWRWPCLGPDTSRMVRRGTRGRGRRMDDTWKRPLGMSGHLGHLMFLRVGFVVL